MLYLAVLYTKMGVHHSTEQLAYYGPIDHPYYGEVVAYSIKNEAAKFVMRVSQKVSREQLVLYEAIEKEKNSNLIAYYGIE